MHNIAFELRFICFFVGDEDITVGNGFEEYCIRVAFNFVFHWNGHLTAGNGFVEYCI